MTKAGLAHVSEELDCDDDDSVLSLSHHDGEKSQNDANKIVIANEENRWVRYWRIILILVLIAVAVGVSVTVYQVNHQDELDDFTRTYEDHATKVIQSFSSNAFNRLQALQALAVSIASTAKGQGQTWPNVTYPDFERRARFVLDLSVLISLNFYPIVTKENLEGYNAFTWENQGWFQEALDWQAANRNQGFNETFENELIPEEVRNSTHISPKVFPWRRPGAQLPEEGPYTPIWYFCPLFPAWWAINQNQLQQPTRAPWIAKLLEMQIPLVTEAFDYTNTSNPATSGKKTSLDLFMNRLELKFRYEDGPVSDLYWPVFNEQGGKLVALLSGYVYWQVYFDDILPGDATGMMAVLENTPACGGQQFTYLINGPRSTYLGAGDLSEPKFRHLERQTGFGAFLGRGDYYNSEDHCHYNVRIYPTQQMEDSFTSNGPLFFSIIVAATFVFTSLVFLGYDTFVEARQKAVMNKAIQSTSVVNTLFPEPVRDRLFEEKKYSNNDTVRASTSLIPFSNKGKEDPDAFRQHKSLDPELGQTKEEAIADLYENCTVFFADIAGFTAWCGNNRVPKDVFQLLEALYGVFDKVAAKRQVFKVETIGDCYLAITGVPKPQRDHAVIMCKFAAECMTAMNQLIHNELIHTLGSDTANLQMRVGMHSGSVTAGVLRGDRARFQLFGDTVNTASRMESNGVPGKIQASETTTEALIAAGKRDWVTEREGGVEAKGKGRLRTWWVTPKSAARSSMSQSSGRSGDGLGSSIVHDRTMREHAPQAPRPKDGFDDERSV